MVPFLNIHTHHPDSREEVLSILCCEPSAFLKGEVCANSVSIGHHPWKVGRQSGAELAAMAHLLQQKQVVAVGEIGLDKVCETEFSLQTEFFKTQLRMAACVQKPVIVHCVKAWEELLAVLAQIDNLPPVVIHGFRGKPQLAEQLVRHNCFLSFGQKFNADTLRSLPLGSFFLETDDEPEVDIMDVYKNVASLLGLDVEVLKSVVYEAWKRLTSDDFLTL